MSASPAGVTAEIHGFSHPDAIPTPWAAGLQEVIAADMFCSQPFAGTECPHAGTPPTCGRLAFGDERRPHFSRSSAAA